MLVLFMQLDMSDSMAWLPKSLCISDFGISLPYIPKLTKYENHGVIQIHHLFPADTEGKNIGRAVGRKKTEQIQTKPLILSMHMESCHTFPERQSIVMAYSQLNPLIFILHYSLFNNFLAASLQAVCVPLWPIKSIKSEHTLRSTVQAA